jgi:urea transport system ATP-binding protein
VSVLTVEAVSKHFGGLRAVDGVSLRLEAGEVRGLIGSNGAGKSTLLDLIFGRTRPDAGTIRFGDTDVAGLAPAARARLGMGLVLQVPSVFPDLTVEQNLRLGALPKRLSTPAGDPAADVARVLDLVELAPMRHEPAGHLSHGRRQWLEIGMVLLTRPRLLLLDEPTSGMTRAESRHTAALLRRLQAAGDVEAMIVVEHNIEFVGLVSDQVTVLHRGAVLASGTIADVQDDPAVQAAYLGRLH